MFLCHHGELGMLGFHPSGDQEAEAMEEKQAGDKWMRMVPLPPTPWACISGRNAKACMERAPSHPRNRFSSSYASRDSKTASFLRKSCLGDGRKSEVEEVNAVLWRA